MASIRTAGLAKNFGDLRAVNEIDLDYPPPPVQAPRVLEPSRGALSVAEQLARIGSSLGRVGRVFSRR